MHAILARGLKQMHEPPPKWLSTFSGLLVGRAYFERDYLLEGNSSTDDSNRINQWSPIVMGIDRVLFAIVALAYSIMVLVVLFVRLI